MLGKKQSSKNEDWIYAWEHCTEIIKPQRITELKNEAILRLRNAEKQFDRLAYAWSGGKDSIVLYDLIRRSGIRVHGGMLALYEHEFPEFLEWIERNKPSDCRFIKTNAFTDDYLNKHPEALFPMETKWKDAYLPPRWKAQNSYMADNHIDCMIMGRRIADGNICGKRADGFLTKSKGKVKMNPIADWKHEEILAYLRYYNLELPPTYFYENGFQAGTQVWTEKRRIDGYYFNTFDLLMSIDPRIIYQSAGKLEMVDAYLDYKEHGGIKR